MKAEAAECGADLIAQQRVAALGTLHGGRPNVTMTPYAYTTAPLALVVLVSGLASHTKDMRAQPEVALMVAQPETAGQPLHALARVSVQATARPLAPDAQGYAEARAAYEARFPDMAQLFTLGDFGLFALEPASIRVVAGFAQAASITAESLAAALGRR